MTVVTVDNTKLYPPPPNADGTYTAHLAMTPTPAGRLHRETLWNIYAIPAHARILQCQACYRLAMRGGFRDA